MNGSHRMATVLAEAFCTVKRFPIEKKEASSLHKQTKPIQCDCSFCELADENANQLTIDKKED